MILRLISGKLQQKLSKKQQEVIQLRWKKAQLEKDLEQLKKAKAEK